MANKFQIVGPLLKIEPCQFVVTDRFSDIDFTLGSVMKKQLARVPLLRGSLKNPTRYFKRSFGRIERYLI
jgi:hypothetical protein